MKRIMKAVLFSVVFMFSVSSAKAFVFSDVAAIAQRAYEFIKTGQHRIETATHYKQVVDYAKEFNAFKNEFLAYQRSFDRVYRKVSTGAYLKDFNITNWDWKNMDDHILKTWRTWNQASWDLQMLALRSGYIYENNPAYRRYADRLAGAMETRSEELREYEAAILEIEKRRREHMDDLTKLQATNAALSVGNTDDINGAQLQTVSNQIALLNALILNETLQIEAIEKQREQKAIDLLLVIQDAERELRQNDADNIEFIRKTTIDK